MKPSDRFDGREPFFIQWHVTDACNLACAHCYREGRKEDLSRESLIGILERLGDFARRVPQERARIQFAGGEPMLSPHLFELIERAVAAGFDVRVLSNGTLADEVAAGRLARAGCRIVQVSVEGDRESHDAIRGAGSFDRAIEGAKCLRRAGLGVTFAMTLSRKTSGDVEAFLESASREAHRAGFHRLVPCGRGRGMEDEMLAPGELREVFARIDRAARLHPRLEIPRRDPLWNAFHDHVCPSLEIKGCSAGYAGLSIDADGSVYPCRRYPVSLGNVLRDELETLWCGEVMERLRDRDRLKGRCGSCHARWRCGGCRAVAAAVHGDDLAEDPQCFLDPSRLRALAQSVVTWLARGRASEA